MAPADGKQLVIADYDPAWPTRFLDISRRLREQLDGPVLLRIDHIGSTAVPALAAKDLIDVQITVAHFDEVDEWPDELLPGLLRRPGKTTDHVPTGAPIDPAEWTKRYWSDPERVHLHVREQGRLNQRYALLFRDYLRADPSAAGAYGQLKRSLAAVARSDRESYYAVKDPACDLIIAAAEHWALRVGWMPA